MQQLDFLDALFPQSVDECHVDSAEASIQKLIRLHIPTATTTIQRLACEWMLTKPENVDLLAHAHYAYHANCREPFAHNFTNGQRGCKCVWCGRSRMDVRWEDADPRCKNRPSYMDETVESVIVKESVAFAKIIDKAKVVASKLNISTLTGSELAEIHHTHGIDPTILESALMELGLPTIPQRLHDAYEVEYDKHRSSGAAGQKYIVIVAK